MAVPKFYEFFGAFLKALGDGNTYDSKEVRKFIAAEMNLTADDLAELLPSKKQSTFVNRVAWARTYLDRAGLISTPSKGHYCITEDGKKALASGDKIDLEYLEKYPSFLAFQSASTIEAETDGKEPDSTQDEKTPAEILEAAYKKVNASLAEELMKEVMKLDPGDFEKLVVKLLLQMGYGNGIDDAGKVTKLSGDGGIDGIIKEDQLGFSSIYIQAKQWALNSCVGRPEIHKFAGALQGVKATKGLFITTARFSKEAREFADNLFNSNIVLVDGDALMQLMIRFNLGVSVEQIYEVKKLDTDFFSDGL